VAVTHAGVVVGRYALALAGPNLHLSAPVGAEPAAGCSDG